MGEFSKIDVLPLTSHVGEEIRRVNLAARLDDAVIAQIRAALLEWKVVFFRNQNIGHAEQIAFAARFGELTYAHPHEDHLCPNIRRSFPSIAGVSIGAMASATATRTAGTPTSPPPSIRPRRPSCARSIGPQDIDHIEHERKLHRITLVGDIPIGVDGVPSKPIQGEPLLAAVS